MRNPGPMPRSFGEARSLQGARSSVNVGLGNSAEELSFAAARSSAEVGLRNSGEEAAFVEASTFTDDPSSDRQLNPVHSKTIRFKA